MKRPVSIDLLAPAKLNLFLHINAVRGDGYHHIQTLFQLLNYGDQMTFELAESTIQLQHQVAAGIQTDSAFMSSDNLIVRAANQLKRQSGTEQGVNIALLKNLPLGAGLGGGSSNAATTLLALNKLWRCGLSVPQLAELGRTLGADVAIFIQRQTALAEGIGEQLYPISTPAHWYIVVTPRIFVSTKRIFSHCQLTTDTSRIKIRDLEQQLPAIIDNRTAESFKNDCQAVAEHCYPALKLCRQQLDQLLRFEQPNKHFQMTGSGASYFVGIAEKGVAKRLMQSVNELAKQMNWYCFLAQAVDNIDQIGV